MSKYLSMVLKASMILISCIMIIPVAKQPNIKIFQIGFNKCGTTTLAHFFDQNGIRSVHWDGGKLAESIVNNYSSNQPLLSKKYSESYIGYFDMSSIHGGRSMDVGLELFTELDKQYTGSKFILNTRDKQAWIRSRSKHYTRYKCTFLQKCASFNGLTEAEMVNVWSKEWDEHHHAVLEYFKDRPQDLLVFNIDADKPEKITEFFKQYFYLDPKLYAHKNKTKVG